MLLADHRVMAREQGPVTLGLLHPALLKHALLPASMGGVGVGMVLGCRGPALSLRHWTWTVGWGWGWGSPVALDSCMASGERLQQFCMCLFPSPHVQILHVLAVLAYEGSMLQSPYHLTRMNMGPSRI